MPLTVETGEGLADADALVSLAECDAYHSSRGNNGWTGEDVDKESAIRRASTFMSNSYQWMGLRRRGRDQALEWPRTGVFDHEGFSISFEEVPIEIRHATAEVAFRELISPGSMTPDFNAQERIESAKVGPIEVTYDTRRADADAARPVLLVVRDLVGPLLAARSGGARLWGETER